MAIAADTSPMLMVRNHHVASAPDLTHLGRGHYISYFMNELQEQLIFVRKNGEDEATLYMGDNGWTATIIKPKTDEEMADFIRVVLKASGINPTAARVRQWRDKLDRLMPHDVNLNDPEKEWLSLCWKTSSVMSDFVRDRESEATGA